MFLEFFRWWYGPGWLKTAKAGLRLTAAVQKAFSIGVILRTLFAPWKRIVAPEGRSLDEKVRNLTDNMTSRAVGFFVRLGALAASAFLTAFTFMGAVIVVIIWPLLPVATTFLLYRSLAG